MYLLTIETVVPNLSYKTGTEYLKYPKKCIMIKICMKIAKGFPTACLMLKTRSSA